MQEISDRLTEEFGKGFDVRNLQQMKRFYVLFPNTNAQRSQLTWTHYRALLRVEDEKARDWYMDFLPQLVTENALVVSLS